jgi:hypothetical protein
MRRRWIGSFGLFVLVAALLGPAARVEADSIASTSTYFSTRQDNRRCASPRCGGLWVKRLNQARTTCPDRVARAECYVPGFDATAVTTDANVTSYITARLYRGYAIVRGTLDAKTYAGFGNLGVLRITQVWDAATEAPAIGTAYLVRDSGIRCPATPCASFHIADLNTTASRNITDLMLAIPNVADDTVEAAFDAIGTDKILVVGTIIRHQTNVTLSATQFYLRLQIRSP